MISVGFKTQQTRLCSGFALDHNWELTAVPRPPARGEGGSPA